MSSLRASLLVITVLVVVIAVLAHLVRILIDRCEKNERKRLSRIPGRYAILEEMARDLIAACNQEGITLIPSYGTLLGLHRDRAIIGHDYDCDFWIPAHQLCKAWKTIKNMDKYKAKRLNILWHSKLILKHSSGLHTDILLIKSDSRTGTTRENVFYGGSLRHPTVKKYRRDWVFPLARRETKYGEVWFPSQTEQLLIRWYGDWEKPVVYAG